MEEELNSALVLARLPLSKRKIKYRLCTGYLYTGTKEMLCADSATTKELEIESCTQEYFSDFILSSAET